MMPRVTDPIFIVGNSRSGTTLLARIFGNHPDIFRFRELHFFKELCSTRELGKQMSSLSAAHLVSVLLSLQRKGYERRGNPDVFLAEAHQVIEGTGSLTPEGIFRLFLFHETYRSEKSIPCDKTPSNLYYIDAIFGMFPSAKIINIIRDPRDILLSQKNKWKIRKMNGHMSRRESRRARINYHPITISRLWNTAIRSADKYTHDKRFHSVYFESLCQNPQDVVQEICKHLGVNYFESMLDVPQVGSSTRPNSAKRGIDASRVGSGLGGLSSSEIYLCERICGDAMRRHGYPCTSITPRYDHLLLYSALLPVQLVTAFCLNISRMRSISESVQRRFSS